MKIYRIAITGAPCSGKTTVLNMLLSHYKKEYKNVFFCPESATQVIAQGDKREDYLSFETKVALNQIENEKAIDEQLLEAKGDTAIVLYDRPLSDCFSYVEDREALEKNIGTTLFQSYARYDAILMLEVAPENAYIKDEVRIETYAEALELQKRIIDVSVGHPHLRFVKSGVDIEVKYNNTKAEIDSILGGLEIERKLLIEYPDLDALAKYKPYKTEISQTYLLSSSGSHRIRKRGVGDDFTYYETLKIRLNETTAEETEAIISRDDYKILMTIRNPKKNTIEKNRYYFLYDGQYFEMDVFPFWNDKAFLELELKDINEPFTLPPEIKLIKDVSDDHKYKNSYLAGLKL